MGSGMRWSFFWKMARDMNRSDIAMEIAQELLDNGALDENNFCQDADALISYVQQVILEHFKDYMLVRGNVI